MLDVPGSASVIHLIGSRSPSAVAWSVWAIVVDAVKFMTGRTRPHVREESAEVFQPFRGHEDSSSTVSVVSVPLDVVAPHFRSVPSLVFSGPTVTVSSSARAVFARVSVPCSRLTSTTFGMSISQGFGLDVFHGPADAPTSPEAFRSWHRLGLGKHRQVGEHAASQILKWSAHNTCSVPQVGVN